MDTLTQYNSRTGEHTHREGDVWELYDGPDFIGYRKCIRREDGELIEIEITKREYKEAKRP